MVFPRALLVSLSIGATGLAVEAQAPNYGSRVAIGEGVVFVAEPANIARPGTIYVYAPGRDGKWAEAAKLSAPNAAAGDQFASALAAHGTTLIAARLREPDGRGAIYVFERRGSGWQNTARFAVSDAAASDSVGIALSLHDDVAAVGAVGADKAGAVYVFRRAADGRWAQQAKLTASDGQPGDRFGAAVAVASNRILVGAPMQAKARGGAYLFTRDANGSWREEGRLVSRTVKEGDALGASVALFGERAVVAAPQRDENTGAVYLFEKNPAGSFSAFTRLFPFEGASQSRFGSSLQTVGDELWIGSPGSDFGDGAVYRFQWNQERADWTLSRKLNYAEASGGSFGTAFAVAGSTAIAGLPGDDYGVGTAVVYSRDASGEWKPQNKIWGEQESFPRVAGKPVSCNNGKASSFECSNVELLSYLPLKEMGGKRGLEVNGIWGWTDPTTGREYVIAGRMDGTSFVDVTDPLNPKYLGNLPMTEGSQANYWREIKVYNNHAFIVADGAGKHGMQVFDLTQLRDAKAAPVTFKETAHYDGVFSAHNIVINEEKGIAFATGSNGGGQTCGGGLHMIDVREPRKPKFIGCFADTQTGLARTGYTHDAQCVTYKGPDEKYRGRDICLASNETALSIADVTDRAKPVAISRASYPNVAYAHQGWLTDDQRFFYLNDEGDEMNGTVPRTRTVIWDVSDLDDPQVVGEFLGNTRATDHNLYVKGDTMYQSNYVAGLRIIDISDRKNPKEVGFFDSVPNTPNEPGFSGSWNNYPFFKSGAIVFVSGREGLFIVKPQRPIS